VTVLAIILAAIGYPVAFILAIMLNLTSKRLSLSRQKFQPFTLFPGHWLLSHLKRAMVLSCVCFCASAGV
jgi:hypothetical protein